jgi:hypothetical protein
MNGLLPVRFERIWRDARPVTVRGVPALAMAPEDLLISLAINLCRKRFLHLKGLFAFAETVRRLGPDWARLAERAREDRVEGIVYTALLVTRKTLEAPIPPEAFTALGLLAARERLLRLMVGALLATGSLADFAGGRSGRRSGLLGRRLNLSLLLPYASYRKEQLWRSLHAATGYHRPLGGPALT